MLLKAREQLFFSHHRKVVERWQSANFSYYYIIKIQTGVENHKHITVRILTPDLQLFINPSKEAISEALTFTQT